MSHFSLPSSRVSPRPEGILPAPRSRVERILDVIRRLRGAARVRRCRALLRDRSLTFARPSWRLSSRASCSRPCATKRSRATWSSFSGRAFRFTSCCGLASKRASWRSLSLWGCPFFSPGARPLFSGPTGIRVQSVAGRLRYLIGDTRGACSRHSTRPCWQKRSPHDTDPRPERSPPSAPCGDWAQCRRSSRAGCWPRRSGAANFSLLVSGRGWTG